MAQPSEKAPALETFLNALLGGNRQESIRSDRCVPAPIGCGGPADQFKDDVSVREYEISGLCQACQDSVFR